MVAAPLFFLNEKRIFCAYVDEGLFILLQAFMVRMSFQAKSSLCWQQDSCTNTTQLKCKEPEWELGQGHLHYTPCRLKSSTIYSQSLKSSQPLERKL